MSSDDHEREMGRLLGQPDRGIFKGGRQVRRQMMAVEKRRTGLERR